MVGLSRLLGVLGIKSGEVRDNTEAAISFRYGFSETLLLYG
jgi:hypothetical protein